MMNPTKRHIFHPLHSANRGSLGLPIIVCFVLMSLSLNSCVREPDLHLHNGGGNIHLEMPTVDLHLHVLWDYLFDYDQEYDWQAEWVYGWDDDDVRIFGSQGYSEPSIFEIRRYYTGDTQFGQHAEPYTHQIGNRYLSARYDFGFWDILAWTEPRTSDGVQSIRIDEKTTYDYVTACTGESTQAAPYNPQYAHSFYQPEDFFAGYLPGVDVNRNLDGFIFDEERQCWVKRIDMELQPLTYIYLVQIILHHNNSNGRKVIATDGNANLSSMARSVTLNTGITGSDAITVGFKMKQKKDVLIGGGEQADIFGGKVMTFGIPNINPYQLNPRTYAESLAKVREADKANRHYIDVNMQFYNGKDSTLVFDVTDQVQRLYRGGVITIHLDMNQVPVPVRPGGSGFDAVVKDFDEKQWEIEM